jgi:asparagine synthase (glutamine-hydrolysing)
VCGICGIISRDAHDVSWARLERMASALHHRGPDDGGVWISAEPGVSAGFAHRRLSIIDLSSAGHQPMSNEDGSIWLTYNGEIYNHADLRVTLDAAGHQYRSHTDSETIIHGFEEWGESAVDRFRGMFAFGLWDQRRRRLTLVRDRLGIKPLYYAEADGRIIFASEIKAILASQLIRVTPAEGTVAEYLAFGYPAGDSTMFTGIKKLPPGHILIWEDGRSVVKPYWKLRFAPDTRTPERALRQTFMELFEESVRLRLMSDVPLGVFLSGGLDSSAIAAVTSRLVRGPLQTFSVGYEPRYYSEFSFAREVARLVGADHHEVVLTADAFFDAVPTLVWHEDEPLWGTASVALYFVSKLAARDVKVVLTGEGSDELFAGYDRYWMTALNARALRLYRLVPRSVRALFRRGLFSSAVPERARRALSHTFFYADTVPDALILDNWFGVISPALQRRIGGPALMQDLAAADPYTSRRDVFNTAEATDLVDRFLYLDIKTSLVELLMKQDQMSMATSIESRVPFLDHKLVEFAASVPSALKTHRFAGKHIVKKALGGILPDSILYRKKMGFPVPWDQWLRESLLSRIELMLLEERALDRGWISADGVRSIVAEHRSGRTNFARQLWALWGLETWARQFLDGEAAYVGRSDESPGDPAFRAATAAR